MRRSQVLVGYVYFIMRGNIGRDASDLSEDHIERIPSFCLFVWTNGHYNRLTPRLDIDVCETLLDLNEYLYYIVLEVVCCTSE